MRVAYDLVAISGPVEGERFILEAERETLIGRSARGVNLPDPMVSVNHARIFEERGTWFIEDLESATGTKVNDAPIAPGVRQPIALGDTIAIGESLFRIDSAASRVLRRLMWGMIPAWCIVLGAIGLLWWVSGEGPVVLSLSKSVRTPLGPTRDLEVPDTFIRSHGIDVRGLALRRVTDNDKDGIDELWLHHGDDELLVTFRYAQDGGGWELLGRFPKGCVDRGDDGQPDLTCAGITYRMLDGAYRPVAQTEPVVWLAGPVPGVLPTPVADPDKAKVKAKAKAEVAEGDAGEPAPAGTPVPIAQRLNETDLVVPYRVTLASPDKLAGFLALRGVGRGAHYIVCEDGFDGLPAQALLDGGEVVPLSQPCGADVRLEGQPAKAFEGVRIAAIALSAVGQDALARHIAYSRTGSPDDVFLDAEQRAEHRAIGAWPVPGTGLLLGFQAPEHFFSPFPSDASLSERVGLITRDPRPPDAVTAAMLTRGRASLDPDGCAELVVRTRSFRCATLRGCLPGTKFIEVAQTGCGPEQVIARAGYTTGVVSGASDELEVRIDVEAQGGLAIRDVVRARVGVRLRSPSP